MIFREMYKPNFEKGNIGAASLGKKIPLTLPKDSMHLKKEKDSMTRENSCTQLKIINFIKTDPEQKVDQMTVLNNSLRGLPPNPVEPAQKMQQGSEFLSLYYINDFHWRPKRNKGKQNKGSRLVVENSTGPSLL